MPNATSNYTHIQLSGHRSFEKREAEKIETLAIRGTDTICVDSADSR